MGIPFVSFYEVAEGWSGGAMVLGKLRVQGRSTIWITVGQGPTALAVGTGGGCLDIFTLLYPYSSLSPSLWETARYRLKYCLKGPLNPKQPINQPTNQRSCRFCDAANTLLPVQNANGHQWSPASTLKEKHLCQLHCSSVFQRGSTIRERKYHL